MASFQDLHLPSYILHDNGRDIASSDEVSDGGWDENFGERHFEKIAAEQSKAVSSQSSSFGGGVADISITPYAIVHGCSVLGTKAENNDPSVAFGEEIGKSGDGHNNRSSESWVVWKASFDHPISQVASTSTGDVIAASSSQGIVSLMKGADGCTLATRRVGVNKGATNPPTVLFVNGAQHHDAEDALIILSKPTTSASKAEVKSSVILVSGIDGRALNSSEDSRIASAAKRMYIGGVNFSLPQGHGSFISCINGSFTSKTMIRFIVADNVGHISIHDYNIDTKEIMLIQDGLDVEKNDDSTWVIDEVPGIQMGNHPKLGGYFMLVLLNKTGKTKICWYHLDTCQIECHYDLSKHNNQQHHPQILSLKVVQPCTQDTTIAAAVALKPSSSSINAEIQVLQCILEKPTVESTTKACISKPHLVYRIKLQPNLEQSFIKSVLISQLEGYTTKSACPYAFRCKILYQDSIEFKVFRGQPDDVIGKFRKLLAQNMLDEADALVGNTPSKVRKSPFGSMHGAEVALWRFRTILSKEKDILSRKSMEQAAACLRRLASGAVTGGETGVQCLLKASQSLQILPFESLNGKDRSPPLRGLRISMSAMSIALNNALKGVSSTYVTLLKDEKKKVDLKVSALKCIEKVLETGKQEVSITAPLSHIQSPADLFRLLVSQGAVHVAERVRKTEYGDTISSEAMASSILNISSKVDPRVYLRLLTETIIPGLTLNHAMLSAIKSWSCHIADSFDRDDNIDRQHRGIDSSIQLLEAVQSAITKLSIQLHSSFVSKTPFVQNDASPVHSVPETITCLDSSIDSTASSLSSSSSIISPMFSAKCKRPNPTVMTLEERKKRKKTCSIHSRHTGSSAKQSRLNIPLDSDSKETQPLVEDSNCVSMKLEQAVLVKEARNLGLKKDVIDLGSFESIGGTTFIAKELVRHFSDSVPDAEEIDSNKANELKGFCKLAHVDLNNAILQYVSELCDSRHDPISLKKAAKLVQLCAEPCMRCTVVLKVLRAALLCNQKPLGWTKLANMALNWATEDCIRSELQEAMRLLVIDNIVRRYCGNGAQEFFRVSDNRHGTRLLNHVCRFIDEPTVLNDALALCDAFTHLSRTDAYVSILQRVSLCSKGEQNDLKKKNQSRSEQCGGILRQIYINDPKIAENVGVRVIMFCAETISQCSISLNRSGTNHCNEKIRASAVAATSSALSILSVMTELSPKSSVQSPMLLSKFGTKSWADLHREFQCVHDLHVDFDILITLSALRDKSKLGGILSNMLKPAFEMLKESQDDEKKLETALAHARRGCTLLYGCDSLESSSNWCQAIGRETCSFVREADESLCLKMLEVSGVLDATQNDAAYQTIVSIAVALFVKASEEANSSLQKSISDPEILLSPMKCIVGAGSLLREHALMFCPQSLLPSMVFLSNLIDTVIQVLSRTDCGLGESIDKFKNDLFESSRRRRKPLLQSWKSTENNENNPNEKTMISMPTLHPTWYVGDGLLLPPLEALSHCIAYCKVLMGKSFFPLKEGKQASLGDIHSFLDTRGAYVLSLRMLACASAVTLASPTSSDSDVQALCMSGHNTVVHLAERSLGGSGTGITSGKIDSQLAFSHLLFLPLKLAFKTYSRCLPSAIARRDFQTVVDLADVGLRAGGSLSVYEGKQNNINVGWKNQENFLTQCQHIRAKAHWWKVLQFFKVSFDPRLFDDYHKKEKNTRSKSDSASRSGCDKYIVTLIPQLIRNASKFRLSSKLVLLLVSDFLRDFQLDSNLGPQKYIEFLFSWPGFEAAEEKGIKKLSADSQNEAAKDIRFDLQACESAVKYLMTLLPSSVARSSVLRRCLISLEQIDESGQDFERYALLLSLYQAELQKVKIEQPARDVDLAFRQEFDRIERRRDFLAILSSFFVGKKNVHRPQFQKCFLPLPDYHLSSNENKHPLLCGVLGAMGGEDTFVFDPIKPLENYLKLDNGAKTASSLAPLCFSLGIPSGYIHARAIILRIRGGKALPAFRSEIKPTIERLKVPKDGAELAEWCAMQYKNDCNEKLECLDLALSKAIRASDEAEQRCSRHSGKGRELLEKIEHDALETVKRLSSIKSALSDKIEVQKILEEEKGELTSTVGRKILSEVIEIAQSQYSGDGYIPPECFAENLLLEGSLMSAERAMDNSNCLNLEEFQRISIAIHRACKCLKEQYSHINIGKIVRRSVQRWLVHGDQSSSDKKDMGGNNRMSLPIVSMKYDKLGLDDSIDDEDTANFVLDLNVAASKEGGWGGDLGSEGNNTKRSQPLIADDEFSIFKKLSSPREMSEYLNARVGLRVAFIMSYTEDFHFDRVQNMPTEDQENVHPNVKNSGVSGKVAKTMFSSSNNSPTLNELSQWHAIYLLRIVFSKSGSELLKGDETVPLAPSTNSLIANNQSSRSISTKTNFTSKRESIHENGKALTFAMRYRALRAASVLCPQSVLLFVLEDQNYIKVRNGNFTEVLSKCCFGAFLAMEIESMGLPLPHSDLVQLSMMHCPSYARALWRDYGQKECQGYKGRLLLLLLELAIKDGEVPDVSLVTSILKDLNRLDMPRTLLLACECLSNIRDISGLLTQNNSIVGSLISSLMKTMVKYFFTGLRKVPIESQNDRTECLQFLRRLSKVILSFSDYGVQQNDLLVFIESLMNVAKSHRTKDETISHEIIGIVVTVSCHLTDTSLRSQTFEIIKKMEEGKKALYAQFASEFQPFQAMNNNNDQTMGDKKDCMTMFETLEHRLNDCPMEAKIVHAEKKT